MRDLGSFGLVFQLLCHRFTGLCQGRIEKTEKIVRWREFGQVEVIEVGGDPSGNTENHPSLTGGW
ncbi:hypothetical protein ALQ25_00604 [Pseudomonas coronafaciens pv. atropurpurea]|nr:hypothetical protein ALQ25_00604 [Pseudomonas coronafaciens pv. atropurpurea]RMV72096.1 hypothetical protein ALP06_200326 [Pseudomonas coronafaciens pv. atropurpurea]